MKHESPARGGRPRSDAAARLAALIAEIEAGAPATDTAEEASTAAPAVLDQGSSAPAPPVPPRPVAAPRRPVERPEPLVLPEVTPPPPEVVAEPAPRRRFTARSIAFALVLTLLLAAVPALGYAGARTILSSRGGDIQEFQNDPEEPGYLALVEPTPTALVVSRDAEGAPTAATLVSLGTGDSGGSVVFVPIDTMVVKPAFLVDRLRTAWAKGGDEAFIDATGSVLTVGFTDVVDLDALAWEQVVAPVAPLAVDNPVDLESGGFAFPAGPLQLTAEQVPAYLDATRSDEDDLVRMGRHQLVWEAWMEAIATSASPEPVPNTTTGIGPYVETLAAGDAAMQMLPVVPSALPAADGALTFESIPDEVAKLTTAAVPAPISPTPGFRYTVRLLNGVSGDPLPPAIIERLVYGRAQVVAVGNASRFGYDTTRIEYRDPNREKTAETVRFLLGGGEVVASTRTDDTVDLVVIIGQETLDDFEDLEGGTGE